MNLQTNITYKVDQFEGPLDLLLSLIAKNKININDIPISIICDQYMEYLESMETMDMELSSEFIVMASELMLIKSRMILPRDEETEEDPRAALAAALVEYQRAKEASKLFSELYSEFGGRFEKETDEIVPDPTYVASYDISVLVSAMFKVVADKAENDKKFADMINPNDKIISIVSSRTVSVTGRAFSLLRMLIKTGKVTAADYFSQAADRPEIIAMFMAVLELLRTQRVKMDVPAEESGNAVSMNAGKVIIFELNKTHRRGEPEHGQSNQN